MTWWMGEFNKNGNNRIYKNQLYISEISNFQIGVHMPILEVVKDHWLDDECLSQWAWTPNFETFLVHGVAHTTKDGWSL